MDALLGAGAERPPRAATLVCGQMNDSVAGGYEFRMMLMVTQHVKAWLWNMGGSWVVACDNLGPFHLKG